ncbi:hypothetical protein MLD38_018944 [Melastoma candidum]|uniref:Uncharacterized protein n=1 Tax=Melastoma candidum TaxID=119954 RepID=A0ACB9QZE9_9MYRT|nr:hypothetical protein MLD38_018944 [Melastoma candidum]
MLPEDMFRILRSVGEECFREKPRPVCYDGFAPSERMHIAQAINVNTSAGCKVKIWIADRFAQSNNKMGRDLKKIQTVDCYMIEIWKSVDMDLTDNKVEFLWSPEEINSRSHEYWPQVMDIV